MKMNNNNEMAAPVHVIEVEERDEDPTNSEEALDQLPETVSLDGRSTSSGSDDIAGFVESFEDAVHQSQRFARHVVQTESLRVNKRLLLQQELQEQESSPAGPREEPSRKKQRTTSPTNSFQQDSLLLTTQAQRSHRMMILLQRLQQVQSQLLDEMNACADDADLRGD
mmetsp:Transcript_31924/g.66628  ORF Transcript_31924/g.66628 Transcript_31924/m.66628 type:complete len:168 (-) Transcript_31924:94-597(-)|eukprot:CAMPEP_0172456202 /NCGR_PEP_ID=MMETSP1065-20121228/14272_1 /TAXON_ID=265537 /ORGANISM="Amphiprora paludosa, Strain CCMP125" /LENGTH=167 /DNA_ID=CAMNT_0013208933 /DNA_START=21 /DNA_END=524 /DNA_ORIENTATION=+